jgi:hypothetical protein
VTEFWRNMYEFCTEMNIVLGSTCPYLHLTHFAQNLRTMDEACVAWPQSLCEWTCQIRPGVYVEISEWCWFCRTKRLKGFPIACYFSERRLEDMGFLFPMCFCICEYVHIFFFLLEKEIFLYSPAGNELLSFCLSLLKSGTIEMTTTYGLCFFLWLQPSNTCPISLLLC